METEILHKITTMKGEETVNSEFNNLVSGGDSSKYDRLDRKTAMEALHTHTQQVKCATLKEKQHDPKLFHTAGNLFYVFSNGIILYRKELFVAEGKSQVYQVREELKCRLLQSTLRF